MNKFSRTNIHISVMAVLAMVGMSSAQAQNTDPTAITKTAVQAESDALLLKEVRSFVLTADPQKIIAGGRDASGVVEDKLDVALPAAAKSLLQAQIGHSLTKKSLQSLINGVVQSYRAAGIQVANVVTPQQDITNGTVQVLVILGRMGELSVEGNNYYNKDLYTRYFSTRKNEILTTGKVVEDLRYMNRGLFRQVDLIYKPGAGYGQTDVVLNASERRPVSAYIGIDNTGSGGTFGEERVIAGVQIGNLWRRDHQLSYQYTTNTHGGDLGAHFLDYRIPLRGRQELQLKASRSEYSGFTQGDLLEQKGDSSAVGLHYYKQVHRWLGFAGDLHLGLEHKETDGSVVFSNTNLPTEDSNYNQGMIGWAGDKVDTQSRTRLTADLVKSINGNIGVGANQHKADHTYLKASFDQRYFRPSGARIIFSGNAQVSGDNLPSTEQFYLGGVNSVRGFKQGAERTDEGLTLNATLQSKDLLGHGRGNDLRAYTFADYGVGRLNGTASTNDENKSMGSVGLGLAYQHRQNVNLDLSYGHRVHENNIADDGDKGRFHGSLVLTY